MNATTGHRPAAARPVAVAAACAMAMALGTLALGRPRGARDPAGPAPGIPAGPAVPSPASPATPRPAAPSLPPGAVPRPWWEGLPPAEVAARGEDFDRMDSLPGTYPEFAEIVRQLSDAGVPREVVRLETREVLGALLQRRAWRASQGEFALAAAGGGSDAMAEANRALADEFRRKADAADAEVETRLSSMGIAPGTPWAGRILQLSPSNPLQPLALPDGAPAPASAPGRASDPASGGAAR